MINVDYTYCSGYLCPLAPRCKRYNKEALEADYPLRWMHSCYDEQKEKCEMFVNKTRNGSN